MAFPSNPSPGDTYTDTYGTIWVYAGSTNGWYRQTVLPGNETTYTGGGGGGGSATATGNAGEIQYTDGTNLAASPNLLWDNANNELEVTGDLQLLDGGTYTTTLQTITPTANRTVSIPDATGTVALVGGSNGQLVYNNAGAYAGASNTSVGASGDITLSANGAASTGTGSAFKLTGDWFVGANPVPQALIQPAGTATSTTWNTSGTGLGVNAASGFAGNLLDLQVDGTRWLDVSTYRGVQLYKSALDDNPPTGFWVGSGSITNQYSSRYGLTNIGNYVTLWATNQPVVKVGGLGQVHIRDTGYYGWASGALGTSTAVQSADTALVRSSAAVVGITNGSTGAGYLKLTPVAVSTLPAAATVGAGTRGFVSDSTVAASGNFGATVTGGGSNNVPVFSDGTNWLIG